MTRAALIMILVLWSTPLQAVQKSMMCEPRFKALKILTEKYGESIVAYGLNFGGKLVEIYRNPKTKTWTILVSISKEISCLVDVGTYMEVPGIDDKKCARAVNGT
jgi:hypothetical protein|tara:strand:- start:1031 stop:1345 length:315 start_codon:yes stop_codon:yes gene_type:complete